MPACGRRATPLWRSCLGILAGTCVVHGRLEKGLTAPGSPRQPLKPWPRGGCCASSCGDMPSVATLPASPGGEPLPVPCLAGCALRGCMVGDPVVGTKRIHCRRTVFIARAEASAPPTTCLYTCLGSPAGTQCRSRPFGCREAVAPPVIGTSTYFGGLAAAGYSVVWLVWGWSSSCPA